jgi:hypothetical protein
MRRKKNLFSHFFPILFFSFFFAKGRYKNYAHYVYGLFWLGVDQNFSCSVQKIPCKIIENKNYNNVRTIKKCPKQGWPQIASHTAHRINIAQHHRIVGAQKNSEHLAAVAPNKREKKNKSKNFYIRALAVRCVFSIWSEMHVLLSFFFHFVVVSIASPHTPHIITLLCI